MIICAIMLVCALSANVSALEVSDETVVPGLTGNEIAYANLYVTEDYVVGSSSYRGFATSMVINFHVEVATNDTDLTKTEYYAHTCQNTGSTAHGLRPGADEDFVWAMTIHTINSHVGSGTIRLSTYAK